MSFLGEVKRRRVFQVAAVYAVVAWLLIQVVATIEAPLNLPDWFDTAIIVLLAVGFPIAIALGWIFDITSAGVVRTRARDAGIEPSDRINPVVNPTLAREKVSPAPPRALERRSARLRNSVAVLPLENLSPNPADAYFAAGIHEEILNYLTKIKDVSVIARTSVRKYAGTQKSIAEIAAELGVGTVMEGSVRYAGDRVRVTVQLIDAATENHLWSEVYERNLADVFAIQADIAEKVAGALEAELSLAEKASIETLPTTKSSEAHALFLKAQTLFGQDDTAIAVTAPPSIRVTIHSILDRAIALDPEFAHPYAMKALLYSVARVYDPIKKKDWLARCAELEQSVRVNAERALRLNSQLGLPHLALALDHHLHWRSSKARQAYEQALELRPSDSTVLGYYCAFTWFAEDFDSSIRLGRKAIALDPSSAYNHTLLGTAFQGAGDYRSAAEFLETACAINPGSAVGYVHRAQPEVCLGNDARALEMLRVADELMPDEAPPALHLHLAYGFSRLGRRQDAERVIANVEKRIGDRFVDPIVWVWREIAVGDSSQALKYLRTSVEKPESRQEMFVRGFIKQNFWADPLLEQPEFAALRKQLGFRE